MSAGLVRNSVRRENEPVACVSGAHMYKDVNRSHLTRTDCVLVAAAGPVVSPVGVGQSGLRHV